MDVVNSGTDGDGSDTDDDDKAMGMGVVYEDGDSIW